MRYPIGEQHFPSIREENKVYVDKTNLIFNLVNDNKYVFLARPRRFGKSLLLSTIEAFFEGRKELFKGLAIEKLEKNWERFPVYHLEFSRVMPNSHESLTNSLNQQFESWEKHLGIINKNPDFGSRFASILESSFSKYNQKAVVLVDEYDNPLINTLSQGKEEIHELNRELLKSVFSNLKACDSFIRFAMLTGVSRFSRMTVFSGLNNLNDISFLNKYSAICGITKEELYNDLHQGVENLSHVLELSLDNTYEELAKWYDGYHFSEKCADIYNPYSLLCALGNEKIYPYWVDTATPEFLVQKLKQTPESISNIFHDNVDSVDLAAIDTTFSSPVALLYQTGYLTIKDYNKDSDTYRLGIPNREVEKGWLPKVLSQFIGKDSVSSKKETTVMKQSLIKGNVKSFLEMLTIFLGSIPYNVMPKISEKYFQNTLYLLFTVMGLEVEVEKPSSFGRSDIVVKTSDNIYIFELKLDSSAEKALQQIKTKGYMSPYVNDARKLIIVGMNFSSQTRTLDSWQFESKP